MATKTPRIKDLTPRFGIGEWFGKSMVQLSPEERRDYAQQAMAPKGDRVPQPCPFQSHKPNATCNKSGGVCSLLQYQYSSHAGTGRAEGLPAVGKQGELRATCPWRFHEELSIFKWVGEVLLGDATPQLVSEVGFLEAGATTDNDGGDDVGRIDMVLVSNASAGSSKLDWCAVEIQAVYFSGDAMMGEFRAFSDPSVEWNIFPAGRRRPDYRSSGPKRLMPQLQIKVPTLRRWGKKMAVVVDKSFFDSIGEMDNVVDISNADIAWFVVRFEDVPGEKRSKLVRDSVRYTTLERSVEGLTGGKPVASSIFEARINESLKKKSPRPKEFDFFIETT